MARAQRRSGPLALLRPGFLIRRLATSKGLFGGSRFWQVVFGIITLKRSWAKIMGKVPEVVALDTLKPGQFMTIEAIGPKDPRRR
jgi:hypothetical protein